MSNANIARVTCKDCETNFMCVAAAKGLRRTRRATRIECYLVRDDSNRNQTRSSASSIQFSSSRCCRHRLGACRPARTSGVCTTTTRLCSAATRVCAAPARVLPATAGVCTSAAAGLLSRSLRSAAADVLRPATGLLRPTTSLVIGSRAEGTKSTNWHESRL